MLLSNLLIRHKTPQPRFVPALFLSLLIIFTVVGFARPIRSLVGLGTTLILASALVLANRRAIWDNYRKAYRRRAGLLSMMSAPAHIYYTINVRLLWPLIFVLGVACLWAAWLLS